MPTSLLFPQGGEVICAKAALNNTAADDQDLGLYTNNHTPANTDTAASYTAASGGGYAIKALSGASWNFTAANPSTSDYAQQTWTFTGALSGSATIYGYYVIQHTSSAIFYAQLFDTAFTPANNGDQVLLTPLITWT